MAAATGIRRRAGGGGGKVPKGNKGMASRLPNRYAQWVVGIVLVRGAAAGTRAPAPTSDPPCCRCVRWRCW